MQASRKRRRTFAAPLVLTAALPACLVSSSNPPQPQVETHDHRTAPPDAGPNLSAQHNPPAHPPPDTRREWNVTLKADGTCQAQVVAACAAGVKCNPPMPAAIDCPAGIQAGDTIHIYADANSWDCYAEVDVTCPEPPATCNPPPPQPTVCPGT